MIEEEEIEEEESEIPSFEEDADMAEFEELEEEVLGQSGDQMVPMGTELMEAVRDAHVNERATGKYEAEGLDRTNWRKWKKLLVWWKKRLKTAK